MVVKRGRAWYFQKVTIKKLSILVSILGIVGVSLWQFKPKSEPKMGVVKIHDQTIKVEVADSIDKRALGLGNRDSLADNQGMLFLFPDLSFPSIWMKGMRFPIDIIWLKDDQVVDLAANVPPPRAGELRLESYTPKEQANQVLELNSGKAQNLNLKIGDTIKIN